MIFARGINDSLTGLVKKLDAVTTEKGTSACGSFAVFLNDEEDFDKKLVSLAKKEEIKKFVLAVDSPAGPKGYNIAKDADVTVILYKGRKVVNNLAFKKGELKSEDVEKIVKEFKEITGK